MCRVLTEFHTHGQYHHHGTHKTRPPHTTRTHPQTRAQHTQPCTLYRCCSADTTHMQGRKTLTHRKTWWRHSQPPEHPYGGAEPEAGQHTTPRAASDVRVEGGAVEHARPIINADDVWESVDHVHTTPTHTHISRPCCGGAPSVAFAFTATTVPTISARVIGCPCRQWLSSMPPQRPRRRTCATNNFTNAYPRHHQKVSKLATHSCP